MGDYVEGMFTATTRERVAVTVDVSETALRYLLELEPFAKVGINGLASALTSPLKHAGFMWQASKYGGGYGMQITVIAPDNLTAADAKEHALAVLRHYIENVRNFLCHTL